MRWRSPASDLSGLERGGNAVSRHERVTARRSAGPPPPSGRPAGSGILCSYAGATRARARAPAPVTHPPGPAPRAIGIGPRVCRVGECQLFIRVRVFVRERTRVILRWPWGRLTVSDVTAVPGPDRRNVGT